MEFTLLPLAACLLGAATAGAVLARAPEERTHQVTAAMMLAGAFWAACEVVWNNLDDPEAVLRTIHLSALGWLPLGALVLHLVVEAQDEFRSRLRRLLPWAYAVSAAAIAVYAGTSLGVRAVERTDWGWAYRMGPLFPVLVAPPLAFTLLALYRWRRAVAVSDSEVERRQARVASLGVGFTFVVALLTDVLLPLLGWNLPRLGSASVIVFCGLLAWGVLRRDFFVLAPGVLAQRIVENLRDGAALLSPDGRILGVNAAFARLVGCPRGDLVGAPLGDLLPAVPGSPRMLPAFETELTGAGGRITPVALSTSPLHDRSGRIVGCVAALRDLTEVAAMRDRVVTAGRLAAVGELAAGIAHEITNPVTWMRANLGELRRLWDKAVERVREAGPGAAVLERVDEGDELLDEAVEGLERIGRLVVAVRSFSHAGTGEREPADVNQLLEASVGMAETRLRQCGAELRWAERAERAAVECAPQELQQLFLNLLINAAHAVAPGGVVRLATRREADRLVIRVEDEGCGMTPEVVRGLFDPVFRPQRRDELFTIGLPTCHEIVRKHGGVIQVDSRPGRGTTFRIDLPAPPEDASAAGGGGPGVGAAGGHAG